MCNINTMRVNILLFLAKSYPRHVIKSHDFVIKLNQPSQCKSIISVHLRRAKIYLQSTESANRTCL